MAIFLSLTMNAWVPRDVGGNYVQRFAIPLIIFPAAYTFQ